MSHVDQLFVQTLYVAENGLERLRSSFQVQGLQAWTTTPSLYNNLFTVPLLALFLPLQLLERINGYPCHGLLLLTILHISRSSSLPHLRSHIPEHPAVITQMERPDLSRVKCPALNQSRETGSPSSSCEGKTGSQIGKYSGRKGSLLMPDVLLQSQT